MQLQIGLIASKSMKIGIIGAMEEEVTLLRDKIENRQTISLGGCEIYTGANRMEPRLRFSGNRASVKLLRRWVPLCCWNTASQM
ncbi:hypothetical protein MJ391_05480 [Escherichia coli]|nr:hypothetical protein MJ391_05480 [Escherichia coli]